MRHMFCVGVSVLLLIGCTEDNEKESLPDWSDGYQNDDLIDESPDTDIIQGYTSDLPGDSFGLGVPWDTPYPVRLRMLDSDDTPCAAGGDYDNEVTCIMEMNELDLWVLGMAYEIVAPEGMCDFIWYGSYMFENWKSGMGPTEVSWVVDTEADGGAIQDEVNSVGGVPYCPYDYTDREGPNCCAGYYRLTVTNAVTGTVTTEIKDWRGKLSECYAGGAYLDTQAVFSEDGWPMSRFIYLDRQAADELITYEGLSDEWPSNVLLANYIDEDDHDGGVPAAFIGEASRPLYQIQCLDDAYEVIAHIDLIVREWNEEAEFDIDGNPDSTGTESLRNHFIDDISDWKVLTPDDTTFPEMYH